MRAAGQFPLEQRLRYERRRKQIRRQADDERVGEPADRTGAELDEEQRRDQRRDVRVEQREEHAAEARVDGGAHAVLRLELLLDALEDEDVGTDAVTPERIESAPSVGPMVCSCRYVSFAGSAPDLRMSERSLTSSRVTPVI